MDIVLLFSIALPSLAGFLLLAFSFLRYLRETGREQEEIVKPVSADTGEDTRRKSDGIVGEEDIKTVEANTGEIDTGADAQDKLAGTDAGNLRALHVYAGVSLTVSVILALVAAWTGERSATLFTLLDSLPVYFRIDGISRLFVTIVSIVWLITGFYSFVYMKHEGEEERYFGFYLLLYGVLVGLDFSGNLITMYLFYELMTLVSMPLVLHNGSREAIMAALKYLFFSMCGAYGGLFGIFFLYRYCDSFAFTAGGTLNPALASGHEGILLAAVFVMIVGFGAKAGMFPLHAWLPTAHPVAPSPASAVLSGIIVKSGVLAIIRGVYYIVGPDFLRGTWVQYSWMILTLLTVFMGSMLAYREKVFKKRLAYSTVSQVSYILFGLSLMETEAFKGALLHTVAHAFVKTGLFLTAGVFLYYFSYTRVEELKGMGRKMPVTLWCYTIFSLALIGIPPTGGFISKWYLASGALRADVGLFSWLGPVVLLVSALLTAGYLLPITMKGFFPGGGAEKGAEPGADENTVFTPAAQKDVCPEGTVRRREPSLYMLIPLLILAALAVILGVFPNPLIQYVGSLAQMLT